MEAIILAGGKGTRLKSVVQDCPKPMAPINDKPFLELLLNFLMKANITKVVLSVGYMSEKIIDYFGYKYGSLEIDYSIEQTPLGTGGAIKKAMTKISGDNFFIFNGDTFFNVDIQQMAQDHINENNLFTMAVKSIKDCSRYGSLTIQNSILTGFKEKQIGVEGAINAGVYLINSKLKNILPKETAFSLEKECLENLKRGFEINTFISPGYFIDIGIPEDYLRAQTELNEIIP